MLADAAATAEAFAIRTPVITWRVAGADVGPVRSRPPDSSPRTTRCSRATPSCPPVLVTSITVPAALGAILASDTARRLRAATSTSLPPTVSTRPFSVQTARATCAGTLEAFARVSTVVRPVVVDPAATQAVFTGTEQADAVNPDASPVVTTCDWAPAIAPCWPSAAGAVNSRGRVPRPPCTAPPPSVVPVADPEPATSTCRLGDPSAESAVAFWPAAPTATGEPGQTRR